MMPGFLTSPKQLICDDLLRLQDYVCANIVLRCSTTNCHLLSDGVRVRESAFPCAIMGFQLELFVDPVKESLKCDLCNAVFRDPVITSCSHVYCEQCLRHWLADRTICPNGCKQISLENDITHSLPLQILVEKLRTRCANFAQGCEVVTTLVEMLAHLEVCDYTKKDGISNLTTASCSIERVSQPEVNSVSQVFVCNKGCGLPLLFQDTSEHDCVKSLQAQVSSLQSKLTRSEHEREKVSARLVKREECMQERFTQLEKDLRSYQEQTLNYERRSRDQRSQINYLRRQLDCRRHDQITEENEIKITLEKTGGILGLNIRGGTEEDDGHCGIYVSKIVENSPASEKLQLYDRILQFVGTHPVLQDVKICAVYHQFELNRVNDLNRANVNTV